MNCLHCHAETNNGLALCELCRRKAETCLTYLPVWIDNEGDRQRRDTHELGDVGDLTAAWNLGYNARDLGWKRDENPYLARPAPDPAATTASNPAADDA